MTNGKVVLMGATNTKDLCHLLLPFFVNGTDLRSLQLFIALLCSVIAVSLGLSARTVVIVKAAGCCLMPMTTSSRRLDCSPKVILALAR